MEHEYVYQDGVRYRVMSDSERQFYINWQRDEYAAGNRIVRKERVLRILERGVTQKKDIVSAIKPAWEAEGGLVGNLGAAIGVDLGEHLIPDGLVVRVARGLYKLARS